MNLLKIASSLLIAGLVITSCKNVDFKKTSAGVPYKIFSENTKDTIGANNVVQFQVIQRTKDTVLFSSYKENMPQYLPVPAVAPIAKPMYSDIRGNIVEILKQLHKGDSVYLSQSTDSILKDNPQLESRNIFKKGDNVITTLRITQVYKTSAEAEAAAMKENIAMSEARDKEAIKKFNADTAVQAQMKIDNKIIEDYVASQHIQIQKTNWGVYVQMLNPGTGPKPNPGQYANVRYKGTSLQGETFDSGVYPLQIGMGGSIKGFEEGVKQLSKGGKAIVYIPSMLGYGPRGSEPKIKPNQVLIFELELLDITDTAPVQAPPQVTMDSTKTHK